MNSCQNFSSSVMRPSKSRTRVSIGSVASRYGDASRAWDNPACTGANIPITSTAVQIRRIETLDKVGSARTYVAGCGRRDISVSPRTMSMQIRIIAISGSLRSASSNTVLLRAAVGLAPSGMQVELYDGIDRLPFFNPDLDGDEVPAAVESFRAEMRTAQGLLICSPEYAHGVPGVM